MLDLLKWNNIVILAKKYCVLIRAWKKISENIVMYMFI